MAKQRFRDIKQSRVSQAPKKEPRTNKGRHFRASLGNRLKAAITDGFMLVMPLMYIVFYAVFGGREGFATHMLLGWIYILLPLVIVQIVFMSRSKHGQTPGMRAYDLGLVNIKTNEKPDTGIIIYRQMLSLLSLVSFGWATMFFRKDRRPLHDLLSGTTLNQLPRHIAKPETE